MEQEGIKRVVHRSRDYGLRGIHKAMQWSGGLDDGPEGFLALVAFSGYPGNREPDTINVVYLHVPGGGTLKVRPQDWLVNSGHGSVVLVSAEDFPKMYRQPKGLGVEDEEEDEVEAPTLGPEQKTLLPRGILTLKRPEGDSYGQFHIFYEYWSASRERFLQTHCRTECDVVILAGTPEDLADIVAERIKKDHRLAPMEGP